MTRVLLVMILLGCLVRMAHTGGEPVKDAPSVLKLASGKEVKVLSITRTTLHGSDEPALSLQYVTEISLSHSDDLWREIEEVWTAFRPLVEREKVRAAVVVANEPASGLLSMSHGAGYAFKQRADGSWGAPDETDQARVPK
jgi:hypothetical protein